MVIVHWSSLGWGRGFVCCRAVYRRKECPVMFLMSFGWEEEGGGDEAGFVSTRPETPSVPLFEPLAGKLVLAGRGVSILDESPVGGVC